MARADRRGLGGCCVLGADLEGAGMSGLVKKTAENAIGKGKPGPGRPKGQVNKSTLRMKEALALLMDEMAPEMVNLVREIRETEGPLAAWRCVTDVLEYNFPKLARTEVTGANGGPQQFQVSINFQKPGDE